MNYKFESDQDKSIRRTLKAEGLTVRRFGILGVDQSLSRGDERVTRRVVTCG